MAFDELYKKMAAITNPVDKVDEAFQGQVSAEEGERREMFLSRLGSQVKDLIKDGFAYVFANDEQAAVFRGPALARDVQRLVTTALAFPMSQSPGSGEEEPESKPDAEKGRIFDPKAEDRT